jgi:hypothetical protein
VVGCCEHDNGYWGCFKCGQFDYLNDCQLLKDSEPLSSHVYFHTTVAAMRSVRVFIGAVYFVMDLVDDGSVWGSIRMVTDR